MFKHKRYVEFEKKKEFQRNIEKKSRHKFLKYNFGGNFETIGVDQKN